ncbi:MAG: hypothetical protein V3S24_04275 [Candidatus Tectomicrobia bacterium]
MTTNQRPPYHWGIIAPARGDEAGETDGRTESLLPPEVITLSNVLGIRDYTSEGVEEAMARYPDCVRDLVRRGAQRVTLNGIPISVQLGRPRVLAFIEDSHKNFGVPADTAGEAVVAAMQHLGVSKIAVGSRWADEVNNALIRYLADAGIEVLAMTSRGQWAQQAFSMSVEMGVKLAFELGREAMRQAPEAEALFLPGGAWRPLPAVPILEEDYGKPVFTNKNTQTWRLIHDGIAPPVHGWGRLLATP